MQMIVITFPNTWGHDECVKWLVDMEIDFSSSNFHDGSDQWQFLVIPEPKQ